MFLFLTLFVFSLSATQVDAQLIEGQEGVCQQTQIVPYIEYETRTTYETRKEWCWDITRAFRCKVMYPRYEQVPVTKEREEITLVCCEGWEFKDGVCQRHPSVPADEEHDETEVVIPHEDDHQEEVPPAAEVEPEVPAPAIPAENAHDDTETEVEFEPSEHHEEKEDTDAHNEKDDVNEHHEEREEEHVEHHEVPPATPVESPAETPDNEVNLADLDLAKVLFKVLNASRHPSNDASPENIDDLELAKTLFKVLHAASPSPTTEAPAHEPDHPIFEEIIETPREPASETEIPENHWREDEQTQPEPEENDEPTPHWTELIKVIPVQAQGEEGPEKTAFDEEDYSQWEEIPTGVHENPDHPESVQDHWEELPVHEEPGAVEQPQPHWIDLLRPSQNASESEEKAAADERSRAAIAAAQAAAEAAEAAHRAHEEAKAEEAKAERIAQIPDPEKVPIGEIIGHKQPHWLHLLQVLQALRRKDSASGQSEAEVRAAECKRKEMREKMEAYENARAEQMAAEMVAIVAQELLKDLPEKNEVQLIPEPNEEEHGQEQAKHDKHTHVEEPLAPSLPEVEKVLQDTIADLSMTHIRMISRLHRAWDSLHQHAPKERHETPKLD